MRETWQVVSPASTFCNPLDLDYRFALDTPSRRDVADPVIVHFNDEYFLFAARASGYWHSRNLRDWTRVVATGLPPDDSAPRVLVLSGRMYYASRGMPAVYTSDDPPAGLWRPADSSESARATLANYNLSWNEAAESRGSGGGFAGETTTGSAFEDGEGRLWKVAAIDLGREGASERRLGIFPVVRFGSGGEQLDRYLGDHPQFAPGAGTAGDHNAAGWMLLSAGKTAAASSTLEGHPAGLAFDEDARTWWSAGSGGVGEWLSVDLGSIARIAAVQINFAEQGTHTLGRDEDSYQQYVLESSIDGVHWTTRVDESSTTRDSPHRYVQLDTARNARFVRIINVHAAGGGAFAIRDLRVFGRSSAAAPSIVSDVSVRRIGDESRAMVSWRRTARAAGYIVRYGSAPDLMLASQRVGDVASLTVGGLDGSAPYWFAVDALGEGGVTRGTPVVARPDT